MAGFLDPEAPSIRAEYFRYIEKDILGKILFKNFFLNVLNFREEAIYIPLGRSPRYDERKIIGDAQVLVEGQWLDAEIKCAYMRITHYRRRNPLMTWGFDRVIRTAKRNNKSPCNFIFAVGINARCLGDPAYWTDVNRLPQSSQSVDVNTAPHQSAFLSCCGIFLFPHERFPRNNPSVTISRIRKSRYGEFFSWGNDIAGCCKTWAALLKNSS